MQIISGFIPQLYITESLPLICEKSAQDNLRETLHFNRCSPIELCINDNTNA